MCPFQHKACQKRRQASQPRQPPAITLAPLRTKVLARVHQAETHPRGVEVAGRPHSPRRGEKPSRRAKRRADQKADPPPGPPAVLPPLGASTRPLAPTQPQACKALEGSGISVGETIQPWRPE